jgi:hypothetical protein
MFKVEVPLNFLGTVGFSLRREGRYYIFCPCTSIVIRRMISDYYYRKLGVGVGGDLHGSALIGVSSCRLSGWNKA